MKDFAYRASANTGPEPNLPLLIADRASTSNGARPLGLRVSGRRAVGGGRLHPRRGVPRDAPRAGRLQRQAGGRADVAGGRMRTGLRVSEWC